MTDHRYPDWWVEDSGLSDELCAAVLNCDCSWMQATIQTGYVLAWLLTADEGEERRVAMAEVLGAKILEAAKTGRVPGMMLQ